MDENEKMESEVREMFGITDDSGPEDAPAPSNPESSATADTTAPTQAGENNGEGNTETVTPETNPAETNPPEPKTPAKDTTPDPEERFNKQNSAFAQMRIQNKELSDLLLDLAKATGQNPKNITEAQSILRDGLTKVISKNRNIPEDVLREMEDDKKRLAEYEQIQAKQRALSGFQQVKDTFTLTRDEIDKFADKLIEKNLNPFEQNLDLVKEYKNLYFDELIAKAREAGIQEERARIAKAQHSSTTPSTQKGLPENTGSQANPIKTIADLDKLLDGLK